MPEDALAVRDHDPATESASQFRELAPSLCRLLAPTLADLDLAEQLQEQGTLQPAFPDRVKPALECRCGQGEVSSEHLDARANGHGRFMVLEARHEPLRLPDPALCQPQLGQPGQSLGAYRGHGVSRELQRRPQFHLGLFPVSGGEQDAPVVGAAGGIEKRTAVPLDEPVRHPYPLHDPLEVGAAIAQVDHLATREDHRVELSLAGEGAGHGLVYEGHAVADPAPFYQGGPELAQGAQIEVPVPEFDGQPPCLVCEVLAFFRVEATVRLDEQHPTPHGFEVELVHQPRGVGSPPG